MDLVTDPALDTYERLAPVYDAFSAHFNHEGWIAALESAVAPYAPAGRRVLDVGCGTGKSALPLLRRGYDVLACDVSPAMAAQARAKPGLEATFTADMRALPECGVFDRVTCLNDAVNYLLGDEDLRDTARSVARLLAPGGIYVFDTNSLSTYRGGFAGSHGYAQAGMEFAWEGATDPRLAAGGLARARVTARGPEDRVSATHVQRHRPIAEVAEALRAAGLELCAAFGQTTGAVLHRTPDELAHSKVVFVARKLAAETRGGDRMTWTP